MVAVKGLSTFKSRGSGERGTRRSGGRKSFKVYTEDDKVKIRTRDGDVAESKRKSIPVKAEPSHNYDNNQKRALNKLEKTQGKNIHSGTTQTKVGRKVLADISNSRVNIQKNTVIDGSRSGKGKTETIKYSLRPSVGTRCRNTSSSSSKVSMGPLVGSQSQAVDTHRTLGQVGPKDPKVFNGKPRTSLQGTLDVTRKSFPILKHVDKADTCDLKKGNMGSKVKSKEKHGFSVKPKVGTKVVPQVSNARDNRLKSRVSDESIKMASSGQATGDAQRFSRRSIKPIVKTTVNIPRAQRVSRTTSVFQKSGFGTSESVSCDKHAQEGIPSVANSNFDASTSTLTTKAKSSRRKSYTSLLIARSKLLEDHGNVTKQESLPNIYDDNNHLEVAEYVDEIYQHYWVTEAHNQSLQDYMMIQTDITPQMRGILINWLIEVHLKFDLMQETLYLMVTLLDHYLSGVAIKKNEMQLVGLTALLLASKYEDFWHPKVMELISISAEVYTRNQVLAMETTILKKLNFRLNLPTPYVFMLRFLRAAQGGKKEPLFFQLENLAFFLIELCLVEYDALHFKPSLLCASALYVARCTLQQAPSWTPLLAKHSRYEESAIRNCAQMILKFHQSARTAVLKVTYDKYMSTDKCRVASIKPLGRLPPL